ncbi:MAG: LysE family transporter [Gammaproteobacteria bacterium]|nr:LysE family transporter [Gammaproteobacteria bacterium]
MPESLVAAFALGLVYNAAPGPVRAETVHKSVAGGFRAGLAVRLGSLAGDMLWAAPGLAGESASSSGQRHCVGEWSGARSI